MHCLNQGKCMIRWVILTLCFSICMTGCMPFHPSSRNATAPVPLPEDFAAAKGGEMVQAQWWHALQSEELDRLVDRALSENFDIRAAWARLRQARAQTQKSGAGLVPSVEGSASGERERSHQKQPPRGEGGTTTSESLTYGLSASYELDIWGQLRSERQAQRLTTRASRQEVESAALSVVGQIATRWVDVLALRQQIDVLNEEIQAQKDLLKLQRVRFINGAIDGPTLTQQRRQLVSAKAALPELRAQLGRAENALATLVGAGGPETLALQQSALPPLLPYPETGLPAQLLAERPDIQAAWFKLQAADWDVAVAQADMLPSVSFSAGRTYTNDVFGLDWTRWVSRLTGNLTAPLFSGGRRLAEVERNRAVVEQRVADYGGVVVKAFQDVRDALVNEHHQRQAVEQTREQLQTARQALQQARTRYGYGQGAYVDVVAEKASVAQLERQLLQDRAGLLTDRIAVYRALGNSWTDSLRRSLQGKQRGNRDDGTRGSS